MTTEWPSIVDVEVDDLAHQLGEVFASILDHDSGCHSYGVTVGCERWFLKGSVTAPAAPLLRNAITVHRASLTSPSSRCTRWSRRRGDSCWSTRGSTASRCTRATGALPRQTPTSAHARFHALPVDEVLHALDQVLDAHLAFTAEGFVAGDLYDGTFLYDFARKRMWLVDLDEYRQGPFTVEVDRLPGSDRYMAPEEWERGATIDERTTVFNLGRAAMVLLDEREVGEAFRGTPTMAAVLDHATQADPADRIQTVRELTRSWRDAVAAR